MLPGRVLGQHFLKTDLHLEKSAYFAYFKPKIAKKQGVEKINQRLTFIVKGLLGRNVLKSKLILALLDFKTKLI